MDCLHYANFDPFAFWNTLFVNTLRLLDSRVEPIEVVEVTG